MPPATARPWNSCLAPEVYQSFEAAISDREQAGETQESHIEKIRGAEIVEAETIDREARVTVLFVTEQANATRNAEGAVIDGDPDTIENRFGLWTFARDTSFARSQLAAGRNRRTRRVGATPDRAYRACLGAPPGPICAPEFLRRAAALHGQRHRAPHPAAIGPPSARTERTRLQFPRPSAEGPGAGKRVGLFVTCLVDLFRPTVGFAAAKLLADAGCEVLVPAAQTCCAQPAWNSGDRRGARRVAIGVIRAFPRPRLCGRAFGLLRGHAAPLLSRGFCRRRPSGCAQAEDLAGRTYELTSFLVDVLGVSDSRGRL